MSIRTKLSLALVCLSAAAVLTLGFFVTRILEDHFRSRLIGELKTSAAQIEFFLRELPQTDSTHYETLQRFVHTTNLRLTLIDSAGTVVFESDLPYTRLHEIENHLHRPEVEEATRSTEAGVRRFVEPAQGALRRAVSKRHHIVFGRRGSGKSSLLRKGQGVRSLDSYF